MTIIKQRAVTAKIHAKHLRAYINDKRALMRDVQNIQRREAWFREMDDVREIAGHNTPAKKGAKNTILYHQVLAFLPEECDVNGGKLTPELCMRYAKEYAQTRYPNQQIVFALHRERCKADGIERYAVHMGINRTDIQTMKRLDEGTGARAKRARAAAVRELDGKWGLQQVEEGKRNSRIHAQQPRGTEKKMLAEGKRPYKTELRDVCNRMLRKARSMDEYRDLLNEQGITTRIRNGKLYASDRQHSKYEFSLSRLDSRLDANMLRAAFGRGGDPALKRIEQMLDETIERRGQEEERRDRARAEYLAIAGARFVSYAEGLKAMEGQPLASIPTLKLPRPPKEIYDDAEIQNDVLRYMRKAEDLRRTAAGDVIIKKRAKSRTNQAPQQTHQPNRAPQQTRDTGRDNRTKGR